jgi:hypothetical protein
MKTSFEKTLEDQLTSPSPSTKIAYASFIIGTLIFLSELIIRSNNSIIIIGVFYTLFAIFVNSITLLFLVYQFFTNKYERFETLIEIGILLTNIPIAALYFYLIIHQQ